MYSKKVIKVYKILRTKFPKEDLFHLVDLAAKIIEAIEDD